MVITVPITHSLQHMTHDEFIQWARLDLDPELLADLGPRPRTYGRVRWRQRPGVRMVRMRPWDLACPWVSERDKREDGNRQTEPFLWPPTEELHPNGWVALPRARRFRKTRPGHPGGMAPINWPPLPDWRNRGWWHQ